ncbi:MAG: ATP-binding protein [Desulfobacteraceae bacterium]|jgi:SpoVK/Ycf46/Vps4 family AAA+-type ATPase
MVKQKRNSDQPAPFYRDNYEYLADELQKLDLLIQRRALFFRIKTTTVPETAISQPMYISHEYVDWLLSRNGTPGTDPPEVRDIDKRLKTLQKKIDIKLANSMECDVFLALPQLILLFGLSPPEAQAVIICLAPELDRKYDNLYAYLQDDITRKKPSVDLILEILEDSGLKRWQNRSMFSSGARLMRTGILHTIDDIQSPSGSSDLARFLRLDSRIVNYLLGDNGFEEHLLGLVKLYKPMDIINRIAVNPVIKTDVLRLVQYHLNESAIDRKRLVIYLHGPYGVGKRDLALGICGRWGGQLLYVDIEMLLAQNTDPEKLLLTAFRESVLSQSIIYLDKGDLLFKDDPRAKSLIKKLVYIVSEYGWLTFFAGEALLPDRDYFEKVVFHSVEMPATDVLMRQVAWEIVLEKLLPDHDTTWPIQLADQFRLTQGEIYDVAESVNNQITIKKEKTAVTLQDLYAACRNHSNQDMSELALKIYPRYGWKDIVLHEDKLAQLKEISSQVKHRYRVFGEWGFGCRLSHGKGLSVLFHGPPGTGKTMAADVIAHELQLDLYKIDLSGVVSKYIGETEKNLSKIFHAAETSNAILFFDEADALFGKRTQVSDAHDRYANIEISYLLQKMEAYDGVVILATNLRENMDEAFTRRIRFIVEFPFPDAESRKEIWQTHFPAEAPVSNKIDYEFLSGQFQVSGGNIKNIVLNAAFLAADNSGIIGMEHILHSTKREYEKIGKLWDEKSFFYR